MRKLWIGIINIFMMAIIVLSVFLYTNSEQKKLYKHQVETIEQLDALKELGCDIVQGYYYSKPIPATDFERFLGDK